MFKRLAQDPTEIALCALRDWRPLAKQGDANAQYRLSALYSEGQDLTQNYGKSRQWYKKAAVYHSGLK